MNTLRAADSRSGRINYRLRLMEPRDSRAYANLMATSPETGLITLQVIFKEDPYEMLMQRRIGQVVVIAETPEGKVVGAAACDARPVWFKGKAVQAVHMHGLMVHPDYRQRGVATALVQWRIKWARERFGSHVLIFAEIQQRDFAAFHNASKWAKGFGQPRESGFLPVRKRAPRPIRGLSIREAEEADYPEIVAGLNAFNHDVDFTRYVTADRLHRNLEPIHGLIFRHRFVVLEDEHIVGGAVLSAHDPSVETRLIRAPLINKVIARLSGMIYEGNVVNGGEIDGIWFKPGYADAAHYLVQDLRFRAAANTSAVNFTVVNPKTWEALQLSRWQPHTILSVAYLSLNEVEPYVEDALTAIQSEGNA